MRRKKLMIIGCNIWIICLEFNWFFNDPSRTLQLLNLYWRYVVRPEFFFNNFLLIDATDRTKISSNYSLIFFDVSPNPHHFSRTLPFSRDTKIWKWSICNNKIEYNLKTMLETKGTVANRTFTWKVTWFYV